MNQRAILDRIEALQNVTWESGRGESCATELLHGTITLLEAVHGERCRQVESLQSGISALEKALTGRGGIALPHAVYLRARGALQNLKGEIEGGIVGSLARTITGEVMSDFVLFAKASLERDGEDAKNVAAVLAAAAFEDTIRRMGLMFAGMVERVDLSAILVELKNREVLQGSLVGLVQSQLQFRNQALHAQWTKIDRIAVGTAIQLVEGLLQKHFS